MAPAKPVLAVLLLVAVICPAAATAADVPVRFADATKQERYENLLAELRCLVCQNQSLADSSADLAQDLRDEVQQRIAAGETDREIVDFLVQRYGDFVLYRPPLRATTVLLWAGPFALLLTVVFILLRRRRAAAVMPLDDDEARRLKALLPEAGDPD